MLSGKLLIYVSIRIVPVRVEAHAFNSQSAFGGYLDLREIELNSSV
jgi:hypothetical protein